MNQVAIVVTGAYGFLGRHTARCLAQEGFYVKGIGHGTWAQGELRHWGISEWQEADLSIESLLNFLEAPYAVIHCAGSGSVGFAVGEPLEDFQRTVVTTANVLEYIRCWSHSTRFLYPSSASVYGKAEKIPIEEDCRLAPISIYGLHKRMAEELIASYAHRFAVSAAIIRFFSLYGRELRKQLLWDACRKLSTGDMLFAGTGEEVRDWLHIDDAAQLLRTGLEHASVMCPIVNGGSGVGITVRELLNHISRSLFACGAKPSFSGLQRPGDPDCYIADTGKARQLGWSPNKELREGIAEYVSWWRQQDALKGER